MQRNKIDRFTIRKKNKKSFYYVFYQIVLGNHNMYSIKKKIVEENRS